MIKHQINTRLAKNQCLYWGRRNEKTTLHPCKKQKLMYSFPQVLVSLESSLQQDNHQWNSGVLL